MELPSSAVDALEEHRHLRGRYVYCQEDGKPLTPGKMDLPSCAHSAELASRERKSSPAGMTCATTTGAISR